MRRNRRPRSGTCPFPRASHQGTLRAREAPAEEGGGDHGVRKESVAMPGRHPDDDLLADLAADVLPVDQAREVEAHVLACDRCASLLSDAEHVRGLLLADDAGPVPPEIWTRIEAALQAASPASPAPPVSHASRA